MLQLTDEQRRLIDGWQRGLPLTPRPFMEVGAALGCSEGRVLELLRQLHASAALARIGVTVRPNAAGASLLAAMRVAPARLEAVAEIVSREPCVNHNYEREHDFNLWFVVTAPDRAALVAAMARLRSSTGEEPLELPMERAYYLDLGFPLDLSAPVTKRASAAAQPDDTGVDTIDRRILAALAGGLAIEPRPYLALARQCELGEIEVIDRISRLLDRGIVSRIGLIVRHRRLGIDANAMAVWNIADTDVDRIGLAFAAAPFVTLCYRRPRRPPDWPFNLFTMVHGRDRQVVAAQVEQLAAAAGVPEDRRAVLFSRRCFVQRAARFEAA